MAQNINQFSQTLIKGSPGLKVEPNVVTCQVASGQATPIVPGQSVKLSTEAGKVPKVVSSAAATDDHFGVAMYNPMRNGAPAGDHLEVGIMGTVVVCEASEQINRGQKVTYAANAKVAVADPGNVPFGYAIDNASGDTALFRVLVLSPGMAAIPTPIP